MARCLKHTSAHPLAGFEITYINQHYGLRPSNVIAQEGGVKDVVFWQVGLWFLGDRRPKQSISREYNMIIEEARTLCKQGKVGSFFIADNLPNQGGTQGNLDFRYLNGILHQSWEAANITASESECLQLLRLDSWERTTEFAHIQADRVHPFVRATVSLAQELWIILKLGKQEMPCFEGDWESISNEIPSSLEDYWCVNHTLVMS